MAKYSFEFKKKVVNSYLNGEGSFEFVTKKYEIPTCTNVKTWVRNYKNFGDEGLFRSRKNELYLLRPHKKGRKKTLDKSKNTKIVPLEEPSVDTSAEHVKELEDELLMLRIENAFLKELRRLRLEDEAKMRERQESSAASEDSSN